MCRNAKFKGNKNSSLGAVTSLKICSGDEQLFYMKMPVITYLLNYGFGKF